MTAWPLGDVLGEELDPTQVFWALSKPGTPVIELFRHLPEQGATSVKVVSDALEQGWARELLVVPSAQGAADKAGDLACDNTWFRSLMPSLSSWTGSERLDKTPDNFSSFDPDCIAVDGECDGYGPRYKYEISTGNSTNEWWGAICLSELRRGSC